MKTQSKMIPQSPYGKRQGRTLSGNDTHHWASPKSGLRCNFFQASRFNLGLCCHSQFCETNLPLLSLGKPSETAPNLFQRGAECGKESGCALVDFCEVPRFSIYRIIDYVSPGCFFCHGSTPPLTVGEPPERNLSHIYIYIYI